MTAPRDWLESLLERAAKQPTAWAVNDPQVRERIDFVCRCLGNRAGVRLLMACLLAKWHRPEVDARKPYTMIGTADSFSGRS